ncbi:MAG TPA: molybdenum cofactor guanylyltransferase MobA [Burkholderiales bacterium]|nr:molybdenum cofactor guanylyltransferase MobA [Burkholderiales bacterium]
MRESQLETRNLKLETPKITGVILAGGQGRRMGGVDKGLRELRGKPMVGWVLERFAPQVDEIIINANQNRDTYARFGHRVIADEISGYAGPLAGLQCALNAAHHPLIATVPCDSPFLPADLVARLHSALQAQQSQLAVARTGDQPHPVFCLCRRDVLPHLTKFLASGGRKIDAWYATLSVTEVAFDDQPQAFSNINTPEELQAFEKPA